MVSWKGIYFVVALFLGSFFGSIFMLGPFLPLMFISPAWYRWITDCIVATWLTLPVALLEMVFGAKVVVTGDGFVPGERSVIIMNHRTRMDWMFLWNCLLRYSYLRLEKICLKSSLKSIPGFGWAMQVAAFVFIQRKWEDDKSHFEQMLDYFCDIREPLQLLIFPEGTDLTGNVMYFGNAKNVLFKALNKISTAEPKTKEEACSILEDQGHVLGNPQQDLSLANPSNAGLRVPVWVPLVDAEVTDSSHDQCDQTEANTKARSNEFAEKNGLQKYEYVLHPRTTGFTFVVERLREGDNLDAIHDITVAYPQNIPQTEKHLLYGKFPKEIHFHVQRYPIETVPASKEELQLWCRKRWEEKEERLRRFYEGGRCFGGAGQGVVPPCKSELRVLAVKCASLLYWMLFPPGVLALLYLYSLARWYFAAMVVFFVVQQKVFGGLELIELACHRYFKKQQKFHETKIKSN